MFLTPLHANKHNNVNNTGKYEPNIVFMRKSQRNVGLYRRTYYVQGVQPISGNMSYVTK